MEMGALPCVVARGDLGITRFLEFIHSPESVLILGFRKCYLYRSPT